MTEKNLLPTETGEKVAEKKTLTERSSGQSQSKDLLSVGSKTSRRSRASTAARRAQGSSMQEENKLRIETAQNRGLIYHYDIRHVNEYILKSHKPLCLKEGSDDPAITAT